MPFKSEAQRRYLWANHPEIARRWHEEYGTPDNLPYRVTSKKKKIKNGKEKKGADITQPSPRSLRISSPSINNIFPLLQPDPEIQFAMREKTFPSVFRRLFRTKLNLPKPNMLKTSNYHDIGISSYHNEENAMLEKLAEKFIRNFLRKAGRGLMAYGHGTEFDDDDTDTDDDVNLREVWTRSVTPGRPYVPPAGMSDRLRNAMPGQKIPTPIVNPAEIIKDKDSKKLTPKMVPGTPKEDIKELNKILRDRSRVVPPKKKPEGGNQQTQPAPADQTPAPAGQAPAGQPPGGDQNGQMQDGFNRFAPGGSIAMGRITGYPGTPAVPRRAYLPKISSDEYSYKTVEKYGSDYYHRLNSLLKSILGLTSDSDIL